MVAVTTYQQVHQALEKLGTDCSMEEVASLCPDLTWNQVFLAIDYLSRTGHVRVMLDSGRTYRVQVQALPPAESVG